MNRFKITNAFMAAIAIAVVFTSCKKNDAEPTTGRIQLQVETTPSSTVEVGSGRIAAANDLVFTSGEITIREVVFGGDNETTPIDLTIEQISTIDYATGEVTPPVTIEVQPGTYRSVYLGIEMQDDGDLPSTVLNGNYTTTDGEDVPVRFEFNSGEVFEAEAAIVEIPAGANIVGKITFDAVAWFANVSAERMDNATRAEDGTIVISETSNAAIFDIVADGLDVATEAVFE